MIEIWSKTDTVPYKAAGSACVLEVDSRAFSSLNNNHGILITILITAKFHTIESFVCFDAKIKHSDLLEPTLLEVISTNHLRAKAVKGLLDEMRRMHDALRQIFEGE